MKSIWFFHLLVSLFSKSYCSIKDNNVNQPPSLLKSTFQSLAKWQMNHSLTKEPFVAYNKISNGILEMFGAAFGDEVTREKIIFLQKITSSFKIHSVVFKWFYFNDKMLKIFDVFDKKLQISVKRVTFEQCYFPEAFVFKGSLELNYVTKISFINCFANEESFKKVFKVFKNAPVTSLTISRVLDYNQQQASISNVSMKSISHLHLNRKLMKIDELKLDISFPNLKYFSLSNCSFDFNHFDLTSLSNLNVVDLTSSYFVNFCEQRFIARFPSSIKFIKIDKFYDYNKWSVIKSAFENNIIFDNKIRIQYCSMNDSVALSVFSSVHFDMTLLNIEMPIINEHADDNCGIFSEVTDIKFTMGFNRQNIADMMQILACFPNVNNIEIEICDKCDASLNQDEIHRLFSVLHIKTVKTLTFIFRQSDETSAFYHFIIELMKICKEMTALEFIYGTSNSFMININKIIEMENIQFLNLDTFTFKYFKVHDMCILNDLFYVSRHRIKTLTMDTLNSRLNSENILNSLNDLGSFSVEIFNFDADDTFDKDQVLVQSLFSHLPYLSSIVCHHCPKCLFSAEIFSNMRNLKNVTIKRCLNKSYFLRLLQALPLSLELLDVACQLQDKEEIQSFFYEKFSTATLINNLE